MTQSLANHFAQGIMKVLHDGWRVKPSHGMAGQAPETGLETGTVTLKAGLRGDIQCTFVLLLPEETALSLARRMMTPYTVEELHAMAQSALCELANIIAGHVTFLLWREGYRCDITLPAVETGYDGLETPFIEGSWIPFTSPAGDFTLGVSTWNSMPRAMPA